MYNDCMAVDKLSMPGDIDVYSAGFPCQPFSVAGCLKGVTSQKGQVIFSILEYITLKSPRSFVLENVDNLLSFSDVFGFIMNSLRDLRDDQGCLMYEVHYSVSRNPSKRGSLGMACRFELTKPGR